MAAEEGKAMSVALKTVSAAVAPAVAEALAAKERPSPSKLGAEVHIAAEEGKALSVVLKMVSAAVGPAVAEALEVHMAAEEGKALSVVLKTVAEALAAKEFPCPSKLGGAKVVVRPAGQENEFKDHGKKAVGCAASAASVAEVVATGVKCADAADGEVEEKPPTMVPMPLSTIAAILSLKREPMPTPKGLAYLSPEERNERLAFYDSWKEFDDEFEEFQKEIIRELKETGRYMVDESYFTEQAERRARMEKEWAKLDWTGAKFGDWDYDDPTCCQRL